MAIDPNIALGVRGVELPNQLAQYAQVTQIQNAQQANRLHEMQMAEYARTRSEEEGARNFLGSADLTDPAVRAQLQSQYGKTGRDIYKNFNEAEASQAQTMSHRATAAKAKQEQMSQVLRDLSARPDDENVISHMRDILESPLYDAKEKAAVQARTDQILKIPFEERATFLSQQGAKASELRPVAVAPGASLVGKDNKVMFTAPERQDTDLIRNFNAAKAQGFAGNIFDYEKKIKEAGRTPAQAPAPTITQIVDPTNPNQMITVDARRYQGGGVGTPGVLGVGGKEPGAALRTNKAEAGKTQLADDLDNLRSSFQKLDALRAIPSTERGALSNVTSALASTRAGQLTGQAFATEAQVERDVINSARSRLVNAIKNATGMSAQQLNSNVELQTMLRSISDPGQSYQSATRIIDDIEKAYVIGNGQLPKSGRVAPAANVITNPQFPGFSIPGKQ